MSIQSVLKKTKLASRELIDLNDELINKILLEIAQEIDKNSAYILEENEKDCKKTDQRSPKFQRLIIDEAKIKKIADSIRSVVNLKSPVGQIIEEKNLKNGLEIKKIRVSLGVVGIIYEARPNVTPEVFSLCFKSKNACVLKGGSDSQNSHQAFVQIIQRVLENNSLNPYVINLLPPQREVVSELFEARGLIDVIIPRGSQGLIQFVRENCKIPVIETGAGVCHIYVDESADLEICKRVVFNSKESRPFACNALDTLLIHHSQLQNLVQITEILLQNNVEIKADNEAYKILEKLASNLIVEAKESDFGTEFLDHKLAIKTVKNFDQAVSHIRKYSSGHSECIISQDQFLAQLFQSKIDAAVIYLNTSIAFTDGGEFGLGCEIGISTQKLHARGPMGLEVLTSYKWLVSSNGQIRK